MRPHRNLTVGILLACFLSLLAGGAALFLFAGHEDAAERAEGEYRTAGWPMISREVTPRIPPSENAQAALSAAFRSVPRMNFKQVVNSIQSSFDAGRIDEASGQLHKLDRMLSIAARASSMPELDFDREWDFGARGSSSDYQVIGLLARCFTVRAQIDAKRADAVGAAKDWAVAWGLGRLSGSDPTVGAIAEELEIQSSVLASAKGSSSVWKTNPAAVKQLQTVDDSPVKPARYLRALRSEAYFELSTLRNFGAFGGLEGIKSQKHLPVVLSQPVRTGLPKEKDARAYAVSVFRFWTNLKRSTDQTGDDAKRFVDAVDRSVDSAHSGTFGSKEMFDVLLPDMRPAGQSFLRLVDCHAAMRDLVSGKS